MEVGGLEARVGPASARRVGACGSSLRGRAGCTTRACSPADASLTSYEGCCTPTTCAGAPCPRVPGGWLCERI
eukprot:1705357-Prymnesium_polylepis.1